MSIPRLRLFCVFMTVAALARSDGGGQRKGKVCSSIDLRNNPANIEKYADCEIVEGFVQIVLMDRSKESDFTNVSFSNLREITQYLLVYRVKGLNSLGQLFPKLALIRGTVLFLNTALTVCSNSRLQDIGLYSLTHIMEGSVVILKNPNLCFTTSVDWDLIMKMDNQNRTYYEVSLSQNKENKECASQEECKALNCERNLCWSRTHCQLLRLEGCHPLCAGGCYQNNSAYSCYACKGFLTEDGECVSTCPPDSYEYQKRNCVSEERCRSMATVKGKDKSSIDYFTFNGSCINECPSKYRKSSNGTTCIFCESGSCYKECTPRMDRGVEDTSDTFKIVSVSSSKRLQSCTHIRGSLEIDIKTGTYSEGIENALENNLGMIEEISGQLKIIHSHALVSLNFLTNLRVIRGKNVVGSQHTLIVKDNKNLKQLWDWSKKSNESSFRIESGKLFFHYNPKLCLSEIDKLVKVAGLPSYSNLDVSHESNGYQTACNYYNLMLNVTVEKQGSNSIILIIHEPHDESLGTKYLGRFIVYYRENKGDIDENTLYQPISECDNQWKMQEVLSNNMWIHSALLAHLEPDVEYAYFVKMYSMSSGMGKSPVQYVRTLPAQPSPPLDFAVNYTTDTEISLSWKNPSHPHGRLMYFEIKGLWQNDLSENLQQRDYCVHKMIKIEPSAKSTFLSTTTSSPVSESNCKCDNKTEKENMEETCNSFEHKSDMNVKDYEKSGLEFCDTFIYSMVNANSLALREHSDNYEFPSQSQSNGTELNNIESPHSTDVEQSYETYPAANYTGLDGKYDAFVLNVRYGTNKVVMRNLRHFSEYVISITACREQHPEEPPAAKFCSREAFLSVRTEPDTQADRIPELQVMLRNQTVDFSWFEPTYVNSFVHSYQLEYRSSDTEYAKYIEQCITAKQFRSQNYTYSIDNLPTGHYVARVKAISLAGDGPYVNASFVISENVSDYNNMIITSFAIIVILCFFLVAVLYYWRSQILKHKILITSVNPQYERIYVEDHWEVPRENLTLVRQLGRGLFGSVHEGILQPGDVRCAVKTTTAIDPDDDYTFLKEATIMKEFHKAFHIVRLLGVVSKGNPVYVIMELMENGDLKSYLLKMGPDLCDLTGALPEKLIIKMASEIADGMAFLEAKKFVHRDLAARNCMVSEDVTIKIGDFGLARDIYETDYYRKGDKGTLPIRWMAPESIRDGMFTSHSDIWSYGVVLWEIVSLAQMPYHPRTNEEVIRYVQSGHILDIPTKSPQLISRIMRSCWRWHPSHRPKFTQLLRILDPHLSTRFKDVSFYHNGENPGETENVIPALLPEDDYILCSSSLDDDFNDLDIGVKNHEDEEDEEDNLQFHVTAPLNGSPGTLSAKYYNFNRVRANGHVNNSG